MIAINFPRWMRSAQILITLVLLSGPSFIPIAFAQQAAEQKISGYPQDWSHHHVIFSDPGTEEQARRDGWHDRWQKITNDPRYAHQQHRRIGLRRPEPSREIRGEKRGGNGPRWERTPEPESILKSDWNQTMGAGAVQPNTFPAKWSFDPYTYSCANDYVVYPTGAIGASTSATIIAYNNLYGGTPTPTCSGTVPQTYWAYNTGGTTYTIPTSPVLSRDGTKVAFTQITGTATELVVLKFAPGGGGTMGSPVTPGTSTDIVDCTAPCMTVTTLSAVGVSNTRSSPYYDYSGTDTLYVGDNSGKLYKVSGVFGGTSTPTVSTASLGTASLASPVYDPVSGCIFVGDNVGFFWSVSSGVPGTVCTGTTFQLFGRSELIGGGGANQGIFDSAILDSTAQKVYAFVIDSAAIGNCAAGKNCVDQFATDTITSGSTTAAPANEQPVGQGGSGFNIYAGHFDNVYYSSASGNAGNLWVLGNTDAAGANLYRIPIGAGSAMSTPVTAISGITTGFGWGSPITEFCNNGTSPCVANSTATTAGNDYLFFSVDRLETAQGACGTSAGNGCVLSYTVNTPTNTPTLTGAAQYSTVSIGNGCWTTAGIVVDNAATAAGTSQIYFVSLNGNDGGGDGFNASNHCGAAGTSNNLGAVQANQNNP